MSAPALLSIAPAEGWSVLDEQDGKRRPVVAWALVADGVAAPFVCGLVLADDRETIELAGPGRYRQELER
jgi:hypothetical protein